MSAVAIPGRRYSAMLRAAESESSAAAGGYIFVHIAPSTAHCRSGMLSAASMAPPRPTHILASHALAKMTTTMLVWAIQWAAST